MSEARHIAQLFPGQGSQWVGMGGDLYGIPEARRVFEEADDVLGFGLSRLCFEGPEEDLRQTVNAQPAILSVSVAYLRATALVRETAPAMFVAGHSLGEYTAVVAAGALDFGEAVKLARERGRLMQEAGARTPGGMLAILGLEQAVVENICADSGASVANVNCPGQIAVSGPTDAIATAAKLAKERGAFRVVPLNVSGAFHSRLMKPAAEGMKETIARASIRDASIPIVFNTTARPGSDVAALKNELIVQLTQRVLWQQSIEWMIKEGVTEFVEVGPAQVLAGFIKRINRDIRFASTDLKKRF